MVMLINGINITEIDNIVIDKTSKAYTNYNTSF